MLAQDYDTSASSLKTKSHERDWLMEARYADKYYLVTFLGKVYRVFLKDTQSRAELVNLVRVSYK